MTARVPGDEADWNDVCFESIDVGVDKRRAPLVYDGYFYKNDGELRMAMLLAKLGVPYVPDIAFHIWLPSGRVRTFVADFVFKGEAFLWHGRRRKPTLIHGIEVKGKQRDGKFSARAIESVTLLRKQKGINILLLSNATIKMYFVKGAMPLRPAK